MINNIKSKEEYFRKLKEKLNSNFDFLFSDDDFELNNFLNSHIYSDKEFQKFKNTFPMELEEKKYRYVFEHSQKFSEIENLSINEYYDRIITSKITYSKNINSFVLTLINQLDKISLDGWCEMFNNKKFKNHIETITPAEFLIDINLDKILQEDKKFAAALLVERINKFHNISEKVSYLFENISELMYPQKSNIDSNYESYRRNNYINVFNNVFTEYRKPDYKITFKGDSNIESSGLMVIDPKVVEFWRNLQNDNFFDPINDYLSKKLKAYDLFIAGLNKDSIECRTLRTILYWLTYLGIGTSQAKAHMENIKNADVSWATKTEKTKGASFYGNSKFAKAFSSYYAFMNAKHNPYRKIINNKEHEKMDENAIALHKLFGTVGLNVLNLDNIFDNLEIIKNVNDIIKILDEKLVVNVNIGSYIKGFVSSIINSIAQILDFSITQSYQQLFFMKIIPFNGRKVSLSDLYNYLYFLRYLVENVDDVEKLNQLNPDILIDKSLSSLGLNIAQFRELGYGAYDPDLNSSSGIIFFSKELVKSEKNSKTYFSVFNDLPVLYVLIEFALEKRAVNGDYYAKKNIIFGSENDIYALLEHLSQEEIAFIFYKLGIRDFSDKEYHFVDYDFVKKINNLINTSLIKSMVEGTKLYEEYKNFDFYEIKQLAQNNSFQNHYFNFINLMLKKYFEVTKENKKAIVKTAYKDQDLGDFDDFLMRFLPSILEFAKFLGYEKETKEALIYMMDKIMTFITSIMFEKILLALREQISHTLKNVTEHTFKEIDDRLNKIGLNDTAYEFDLGIGSLPFIESFSKTIDYIDEFLIKIPRSIIPCFIQGDYGMAEKLLIEASKEYKGNLSRERFKKFEVNENDEKIENKKIEYEKPKDWKVYYIDNNGEKIELKNNNRSTLNRSILSKPIIKNEKIETAEEKIFEEKIPKKIVYNNGRIELIYNDNSKEVLIDKNNNETYKRRKINNNNNKNNEFDFETNRHKPIEKILSNNQIQRIKEIKNFIDQMLNIDYYNIKKDIEKEKEKLETELKKNLPNYNEIRKIRETIEKLTFKLENVKRDSVLNTNKKDKENISLLNFDKDKKIIINSDKYRNLDDFFNKKIEVLSNLDNDLSKIYNKETYLSTYQITQLLK